MIYRRLFAVVVAGLVGAPVFATEIDINGNWQVTFNCGPNSDLTGTVVGGVVEDVNTGDGTTTQGPDCGSSTVDGALRIVQTCTQSPLPQTVKVSGTNLTIPATGYTLGDSTYQTPFPSATFNCISPPLARLVVETRIDGVITTDGSGRAVRVDGTVHVGQATGYNSDNNVCFNVNFGDASTCTIVYLRNDVSTGSDVTVQPRAGSSITFSQVDTPGTASVTPEAEPSAALPPNFQLAGPPVYFEVSTDAQVSGPITVCLPYADADNDGFVDNTNPPIDETALVLLHEENGVFVDRTVSHDPVNNQVCAQTNSLSQFLRAVGVPARPPIDYTPPSAGTKDSASLTCQSKLSTASKSFMVQKYNLLHACAAALQEYKARQTGGLSATQIQAALAAARKACVEPSATAPDAKTMLGKIDAARTKAISTIEQHCGTPGGMTIDNKTIGSSASSDLTAADTMSHADLVGCEAERLLGLAYNGIRTDLTAVTARGSQGGLTLNLYLPCLGN